MAIDARANVEARSVDDGGVQAGTGSSGKSNSALPRRGVTFRETFAAVGGD
jgi:hypothetical protein